MGMAEEILLRINGTEHRIHCDPATPLLFVLRNQLGLAGAKLGCGLEQCGACAVLMDGVSQLTCATGVGEFQGRDIVTVEGLSNGGTLSAVQQAFVDAGAAQCGYCTPWMVVAVTAMLDRAPSPTKVEITEALTPHLCRCGAHPRILEAVARLIGPGGVDD